MVNLNPVARLCDQILTQDVKIPQQAQGCYIYGYETWLPQAEVELKELERSKEILDLFLSVVFVAGDNGSGDVGIRPGLWDRIRRLVSNPDISTLLKDGLPAGAGKISECGKKIEFSRDESTEARFFTEGKLKAARALSQAGPVSKQLPHIVGVDYGTQWAREPKPSDWEKNLIHIEMPATEKQNPYFKTGILSIEEECLFSAISAGTLAVGKNPKNEKMVPLTSRNISNLEVGRRSSQGPLLFIDKAGIFIDKELEAGKSPSDAKEALKKLYLNAFTGNIGEIKYEVLQGLAAIGVMSLDKALKVSKDEWVSAQIPVALPQIIKALQEKIAKAEQNFQPALDEALKNVEIRKVLFGSDDNKTSLETERNALIAHVVGLTKDAKNKKSETMKTSAALIGADGLFGAAFKALNDYRDCPAATTLALLEAFQEKYGDDFDFLCAKKDTPRYNEDGTLTGESFKITGSHGAATLYFETLQKAHDTCTARIQELAKEIHIAQVSEQVAPAAFFVRPAAHSLA